MTLERVDIADCEDLLQVALHRARYDFVLDRLEPGMRVLEIGTGTGTFTRELFPKCGGYVGLEYDRDSAELTRKRTDHKAEIVHGDARKLPFADNDFSLVICLEVLEHLGDFRAGVRGIHRCVRPDGKAIISVPWRRFGGRSATNEHHPYEPGEGELIAAFKGLFRRVEVYYQYFEEDWGMTIARVLHLRRFLGLSRIYADLTAGLPHATARLQIASRAKGMKLGLILLAADKKVH